MTKKPAENTEGNDASVASNSNENTTVLLTESNDAEAALSPAAPSQDNDSTVITSLEAPNKSSQLDNAEDDDATVVSTSIKKTAAAPANSVNEAALPPATPTPDNDSTVITIRQPPLQSSQLSDAEDNDATVVSTPNRKTTSVLPESSNVETLLSTESLPPETLSRETPSPEMPSPEMPLPDNDSTVLTSPRQENQSSQVNTHTQADSTHTYTETKNPLTNTFHKPFVLGGEAIKDRFIIKKVLGQGGMGMVCQALDLRRVEADDEEPYIAIKLLSDAFQQHASAFKSLQRETKKTQALAHPNIITVYDFDRDGDTIFMTMEELDGYPLDAVIKGSTDVELNPKSALKIVREIALALEYAHSKGIIHSDLKPGNIFYTKTGQTKVLDFGIARALNSELYKDNFDAGDLNALTPKYASLEMFEHADPDPRDDIYALGVIAGQLLGGEHPYRGKTAVEVRDGDLKPVFSKNLGSLYKKAIVKAVALNREDRTQSASKFLSSLNWAEKGARRVMIAVIVVILLAIGNAFLIDSVDTSVPLSDLPAADQQVVLKNIEEADTALKFQDYNGALVYLDRAYQLHPSNADVEDRSEQIITVLKEQLEDKKDDADYRQFMLKQIVEVGKYDFMARNEQYQALQKRLQ
ncbi:MAG: serine/threonine protein kinase [Oceanicoccus sp.]|jgi:serine/threonine protein kinase